MELCKEFSSLSPRRKEKKRLYYISAEFLIGRLLRSQLMNLGLEDEAEKYLLSHGRSLGEIEEAEPEPSLGNGGLGRLAACFLDSIASLDLPGDGIGLNYHYGLFLQSFQHHAQTELPNPWIASDSWLTDTGVRFTIPLGCGPVEAKLCSIPVPGYKNGRENRLLLFDTLTPPPLPKEGISFDQTDIASSLTAFLYPDDSTEEGRLFRVYQQYFMVSSAAQLILKELKEDGYALESLPQHVVIQINDTHPSMIIPELIRLLTEEGLSFTKAVHLVEKTCAYTNHTILAEALEKWPLSFIEKAAPLLVPILEKLDRRMKRKFRKPSLAIIDGQKLVHMARLDIHYGFSVNGVAALHTEILKHQELKDFYEIYPEKFSNKTNGITFRRWLIASDPALSSLITKSLGTDAWMTNLSLLEDLLPYREDKNFLEALLQVKKENKEKLSAILQEKEGFSFDSSSVTDIQIKRMHQYKRQQMNALYAIWKYKEIKAGRLPRRPITMIFGAKAAPAYTLAKDTIHLLLCLEELFRKDPEVSPHLCLHMVENYNVSMAEKLIPAADISEQISLASKEASGTGNMKMMANGALTLGTLDGANVEISELVGDDNIFLFGKESDEVIRLYKDDAYCSKDYALDSEISPLVDFIMSPELLSIGDPVSLLRVYKDFLTKDYFMTLLDLKDYIRVKEFCLNAYEDRMSWAEKMLVNIAKSHYFSSDRTIGEYNRDIWHL